MHKDKLPFFVCAVKKAILTKTRGSTNLEVFLNQKDFVDPRPLDSHGMSINPWIIALTGRKNPGKDYLLKQLKKAGTGYPTDIASDAFPLRWCGSGGLVVLKDNKSNKFVVLNRRHAHSVWGGYFDANGGYSSNVPDMLYPEKLAIREIKEEVKIKHAGKLIKLKTKVRSQVIIHYRNKIYTYKNLIIIIDWDLGTVDFRLILGMKIKDIENININDGETMFVSKTKQARQKRPILLVSYKDIANLILKKTKSIFPIKCFLDGKKVRLDRSELQAYKITLNRLTPALTATLKNAINI